MKTRQGFVSNSSSSSFVLKVKKIPTELMEKINKLTDESNDTNRCTGRIINIKGWLAQQWISEYYKEELEKFADDDHIIVRYSDEQMGGDIEDDYGISINELAKLAEYEFEYH